MLECRLVYKRSECMFSIDNQGIDRRICVKQPSIIITWMNPPSQSEILQPLI